MTPAQAEALVPLAAELVGTVRDYGPADVAAVLARVPEGRHDALCVVLAAMVDPDARPGDLLAWTHAGPVQSREVAPAHLQVSEQSWGGRSAIREEVAELTGQGMAARDIAQRIGITPRSVHRHQQALREASQEVA